MREGSFFVLKDCGATVLQFGVNFNTAKQHNGSTMINLLRLASHALTEI